MNLSFDVSKCSCGKAPKEYKTKNGDFICDRCFYDYKIKQYYSKLSEKEAVNESLMFSNHPTFGWLHV